MFEGFSKLSLVKIRELQLSGTAVKRRNETFSNNMQAQLESDLQKRVRFFLLQLDKSADVQDTTHLTVLLRW